MLRRVRNGDNSITIQSKFADASSLTIHLKYPRKKFETVLINFFSCRILRKILELITFDDFLDDCHSIRAAKRYKFLCWEKPRSSTSINGYDFHYAASASP